MTSIPFGITDWSAVEPERHEGESGFATCRTFELSPGMSYQVADNAEAHRSRTGVGAQLFIVD